MSRNKRGYKLDKKTLRRIRFMAEKFNLTLYRDDQLVGLLHELDISDDFMNDSAEILEDLVGAIIEDDF